MYSWLLIDPSEQHYTTQTSKFDKFLNQASTMLNNVFIKLDRDVCIHTGALGG